MTAAARAWSSLLFMVLALALLWGLAGLGAFLLGLLVLGSSFGLFISLEQDERDRH